MPALAAARQARREQGRRRPQGILPSVGQPASTASGWRRESAVGGGGCGPTAVMAAAALAHSLEVAAGSGSGSRASMGRQPVAGSCSGQMQVAAAARRAPRMAGKGRGRLMGGE